MLGAAQGRALAALTGVFLTRVAIGFSGPFHLCCLYSLLKVLFLLKAGFCPYRLFEALPTVSYQH